MGRFFPDKVRLMHFFGYNSVGSFPSIVTHLGVLISAMTIFKFKLDPTAATILAITANLFMTCDFPACKLLNHRKCHQKDSEYCNYSESASRKECSSHNITIIDASLAEASSKTREIFFETCIKPSNTFLSS